MNGPKAVFGGFFGYFSGWALLIAAMVFMVTGCVPLGTATIDLFNPALASNVLLTTVIGAVWFLAIGAGADRRYRADQQNPGGDELHRAWHPGRSSPSPPSCIPAPPARSRRSPGPGSASTIRPAPSPASALIVVFLYWGWDVTCNLSRGDQGPSAQCRRQWRVSEHFRHHRLLRGLHRGGADDVHAAGCLGLFR